MIILGSLTSGLDAGVAGSLGAGGATPSPSVRLMSSRNILNGTQGATVSSGSVLNSNSRIGFYNELGVTVTKVKTTVTNWRLILAAAGEINGTNPITITHGFEYPAGTITPFTFGGQPSVTIDPTNLFTQPDELVLPVPVPANALFWIRTYVSGLSNTQTFPTSYFPDATFGDLADSNGGVDKSSSGTITSNLGTYAYGPNAVIATAWTGTPKSASIAMIADSIGMGGSIGGSYKDAKGNIGWIGNACAGRAPFLNMSLSGTSASANNGANFARRKALLGAIGVTHAVVGYGINDLQDNTNYSETQILGFLSSIWADIASVSVKPVQVTITPKTNTTTNGVTAAGQTPFPTPTDQFISAGSVPNSRRGKLNALIRAKPSPLFAVLETADAVEVDATGAPTRNGGLWATWETGQSFYPTPVTGIVVQAGATTTSVPTGLTGAANGDYTFGDVTFTSGSLAGQTFAVFTNTGGTFTFAATGTQPVAGPLPSVPAAGDTLTAYKVTSHASDSETASNYMLHPDAKAGTAFGGQSAMAVVLVTALMGW